MIHKVKRLFLLAGYDRDSIIDDALVYYVSCLSGFGDVILYMDCDAEKSEINKVEKYCLYAYAVRHHEYDFGSYKRAYQCARDKNILNNYDYVYLVNDSVFGPLFDMGKTLDAMESNVYDATGIVVSHHKTHSFMESWFIKLNKKIFTSTWFDEFLSSVKSESRKTTVTIKYEHGLSKLIKNNKCSWNGLNDVRGRYTYNNPCGLVRRGCPFIKRMSFTRHDGEFGNQIKYILRHSNPDAVHAIMHTANRIYGAEYMRNFLTYNPIKIIWRGLKYATRKIMDEIK